MRIKTFEAATMEEALLLARKELGDDAVVLNTKHVKNASGIVTKVELMAAVDDGGVQAHPQKPAQTATPPAAAQPVQQAEPKPAPAVVPQPKPAQPQQVQQPIAPPNVASAAYAKSATPGQTDAELAQLKSEVKNLSDIVQQLLNSQKITMAAQQSVAPSIAIPLIMRLGVDEDLAKGILADCLTTDDPNAIASILAAKMQAFCAPPSTDRKQIITVVGPTGVGKTTTLAKLAARFALEQGKRVALVSADTYRIGAVEQLRTYARIMGVPIEVGLSPQEVAAGVQAHDDKDVILIDTVGRSQRNDEHLAELKTFVDAAEPTEIYLVVSASLSGDVQREVVDKFSALSPTKLAITKLDEAPHAGCLVNLPLRTGLGISCVTAGQNVPQDLDFADAGRIARTVVEVL